MENQNMFPNWNRPTAGVSNMQMQPMQQQNYPMNMQNMSQASAMQQSNPPQVYYIPGRSVNSPEEVQSFEVLMTSPMNIFPKNDRSEIYVKYWGSDGRIETDVYVKVDKNQTDAQNMIPPVAVPHELVEMKKQLDQILKLLKYQKPRHGNQNKQQKEIQK